MLSTLYVDMNSYFASVEQQSRPELRGRPVAVVPVETDSTSCIAASYEAKAFGVRTGTNVGEARRMCPGLVLVKGRPDLYVRTHHAVIEAIDRVLPVAGVHSIDEFSCRLLGAERERARAETSAPRPGGSGCASASARASRAPWAWRPTASSPGSRRTCASPTA